MALRNHITNLDTAKRGHALLLQMAARTQEICMASGAPKLIAVDGVKDIVTELRAYIAQGALDAV